MLEKYPEPVKDLVNSEWEQYQRKVIGMQNDAAKHKTVLDLGKAAIRYCTKGGFDVDADNKPVIDQLILYINQDPAFDGNLSKGICICGPKGTGKSILLKAMNTLLPEKSRFSIDNMVSLAGFYSQKDIGDTCFNQIIQSHLKGSKNHRLGNDLGREKNPVMYMGNSEDVGAKYVYERYELFQNHRVKTHFTTNIMTTEDFQARYGDLNYDRIKEMCNFLFLEGPSRR